MVNNVIKQQVKRRVLWWVVGGGLSAVAPVLGIGALGLLVIPVVMSLFSVFGGLGYHAQNAPPPLPAIPVYSAQWLPLAQRVAAARGLFVRYPGVLWVAAMAASSGGMALDRTRAGGYGLFDLRHAGDMGAPTTAMNAFAADLADHAQSQNLQATLNAVGQTLAPANSQWSAAVRSAVNNLERGPEVVAWPALVGWNGSGWAYPAHQTVTIAATAAAPVGNAYQVAWTPPYTVCTPGVPTHYFKNGKPKCHTVTDNLSGRDLEEPASMVLTTADGQRVPMIPETTAGHGTWVFPHSVLYVTARKVLVNARHTATITASWGSHLTVSTTLPGTGFGANATGPVGVTPLPGNPKTLGRIWAAYGADIRAAIAHKNTPASLLASEAYWESRGVAYPYAGPKQACGVWQMFSPGSFTAFAPAGTTPAACAVPALEARSAAGYFAYLYGLFGSWRIAIAGYYGGQGSVLSAGVRRGMSWTQAAPRLNWIPAPGPNTKTMTMYAETSFRTARVFAKTHHLPPP